MHTSGRIRLPWFRAREQPNKWRGARLTGATLLAAAIMAGCSALSVPSGPGIPVGPSFRNSQYVLTLIATEEPHAPRLQPNQVQALPHKVGLLLTPVDGSPAPAIIEIATGVSLSSDTNAMRIIAVDGDLVWIRAGGIYVYDLDSGRLDRASDSPPDAVAPPFSDAAGTGWKVSETRWIGLHLPEDVTSGKLKPGSPVMPGIIPLRSVPYEPVNEGQVPTRERRNICTGQIDPSGPIPRFVKVEAVSDEEYSNGVVLIDTVDAEGGLIAYEGRYPDLTLRVARIDLSGKLLWNTDTRITRDPQILFGPASQSGDPESGSPQGADLIVLRGVPQVPSGQFPQPILILLDPRTGKIASSELRW